MYSSGLLGIFISPALRRTLLRSPYRARYPRMSCGTPPICCPVLRHPERMRECMSGGSKCPGERDETHMNILGVVAYPVRRRSSSRIPEALSCWSRSRTLIRSLSKNCGACGVDWGGSGSSRFPSQSAHTHFPDVAHTLLRIRAVLGAKDLRWRQGGVHFSPIF